MTVSRRALTLSVFLGVSVCVLVGESRPRSFWLDVPFVRQSPEGCGAACISMVMRYWYKDDHVHSREDSDPAVIQRRLFDRRAGGIVAADMERYFQEKGFRTFAFRGDWKDLQNHLSKGRPLIVCLGEGSLQHTLHYVVVVGLDDVQGVVFVNDPARRKLLKLDRARFEKRWSVMDSWTLLALPRRNP